MTIDEHNQYAFDSLLKLAKERQLAAEDAEIKDIEVDYPRFKDTHDKEGETSGYIKTLADEDGKIHWLMAKSYHEELSEIIWRSDGLSSVSVEQQNIKIGEYTQLKEAKETARQAQFEEKRAELSEHIQRFL